MKERNRKRSRTERGSGKEGGGKKPENQPEEARKSGKTEGRNSKEKEAGTEAESKEEAEGKKAKRKKPGKPAGRKLERVERRKRSWVQGNALLHLDNCI